MISISIDIYIVIHLNTCSSVRGNWHRIVFKNHSERKYHTLVKSLYPPSTPFSPLPSTPVTPVKIQHIPFFRGKPEEKSRVKMFGVGTAFGIGGRGGEGVFREGNCLF